MPDRQANEWAIKRILQVPFPIRANDLLASGTTARNGLTRKWKGEVLAIITCSAASRGAIKQGKYDIPNV